MQAMTISTMTDEELQSHIAEQESRIVFTQFSIKSAHDIGLALVAAGQAASLPIAIDVTRAGQCLFHCALEGATPDNAQWVQRKIRVVQRFHHSSLYMGAMCRAAGVTLEEKFLLPANTFAAHGGAFPITLKHAGVVGSVTVSGLPQLDDHALVVSVLEQFITA